ncbi:cupredoxin domain-containing protein [Undibacterium sp. TS12]|uniref:cupredoxin domain-containing protein n=1 Tax=Undibacterium sp. TS12 TaxID=2908202 RepID=UPI001F4D1409|nr:cupredoxin domain-containing protein [Undibacterium sp. TS12]MCH8617602.1 cupredoxin domain-containing protein [Undibacterium sp. TS12]
MKTNQSRRLFCTDLSLSLLGAGASLVFAELAMAEGAAKKTLASRTKPRVIPITAKKFSYEPSRIEARVGESIVLAFSALDFTHGFNLPEFNLRMDLVPGKVINIQLNLDKAGEYDFLCDNFCGDGHEGMSGKLIVNA